MIICEKKPYISISYDFGLFCLGFCIYKKPSTGWKHLQAGNIYRPSFSSNLNSLILTFSTLVQSFAVVTAVTKRLQILTVESKSVIVFSLNDVVHDISSANNTSIKTNTAQRIATNETTP